MNVLNKATLLASALLMGLSLSSISHAEKIYLWYTTDDKGNDVPKYGTNPPLGVEATLVSDTKDATPAPQAQDSDANAPLTEEQKHMREKRKEECKAEEQRLKTLETSGSRIRMAEADGTTRYLTPDEILKEIELSKEFLKSACDS